VTEGVWKGRAFAEGDAVRMKHLIEQYQTQSYRSAGPPAAAEVSRG
jgi:hypothetical protein